MRRTGRENEVKSPGALIRAPVGAKAAGGEAQQPVRLEAELAGGLRQTGVGDYGAAGDRLGRSPWVRAPLRPPSRHRPEAEKEKKQPEPYLAEAATPHQVNLRHHRDNHDESHDFCDPSKAEGLVAGGLNGGRGASRGFLTPIVPGF